jgi:hypothetical protein
MNLKSSACLLACSLALRCSPPTPSPRCQTRSRSPMAIVMLETVGVGEITYECRDKANTPGQTEWTFVGPKAVLNDRAANRWATTLAHPPPGRPRMARKSPAPSWQWRRRTKAPCPINWSRPTRPKAKAPCRGSAISSAWPPAVAWRRQRLHGAEQRCQAGRPVPGRLCVLDSQVKRLSRRPAIDHLRSMASPRLAGVPCLTQGSRTR